MNILQRYFTPYEKITKEPKKNDNFLSSKTVTILLPQLFFFADNIRNSLYRIF